MSDQTQPAATQGFFDPNWREFHKLWSLRVVAFGWLLSALFMFWPSLAYKISPFYFALGCLVLMTVIGIARLKNQPGLLL